MKHADEGIDIRFLQELLSHKLLETTQNLYSCLITLYKQNKKSRRFTGFLIKESFKSCFQKASGYIYAFITIFLTF